MTKTPIKLEQIALFMMPSEVEHRFDHDDPWDWYEDPLDLIQVYRGYQWQEWVDSFQEFANKEGIIYRQFMYLMNGVYIDHRNCSIRSLSRYPGGNELAWRDDLDRHVSYHHDMRTKVFFENLSIPSPLKKMIKDKQRELEEAGKSISQYFEEGYPIGRDKAYNLINDLKEMDAIYLAGRCFQVEAAYQADLLKHFKDKFYSKVWEEHLERVEAQSRKCTS